MRLKNGTDSTLFVVLAAGLLAGAGCGDSDDASPVEIQKDAGVGDATADTRGSTDTRSPDDAGMDADASRSDVRSDAGSDAGAGPPPITCPSSVPTIDPTSSIDDRREVSFDEVVIGQRSGVSTIGENVREGTFRVPQGGTSEYGAYWVSAEPEDNGEIPSNWRRGAAYYVATRVKATESTEVHIRPRAAARIFVNGERRYPGDIYSNTDKDVPVRLDQGCNLIAMLVTIRGGTPRFEMFRTPSEVVFNKRDTTLPTLRVGSETKQPAGISVLNVAGEALLDVEAKVVGNSHFESTTVEYPSIPADAVTQLAFQLEPKSAWSTPDEKRQATLRIESPTLSNNYEATIEMETVAADERFIRTFRSPVDGSAQYFQVTPPSNYSPMKKYGLAMTMHGAGVGARGTSYYQKRDWLYFILPTNRRPFGFDWEEWGRLNGLAALETAKDQFDIDPTKIYATGHSMGGHGTWHLGVMHPGKFAAIGPSAGWASFYTYPTQSSKPSSTPVRRARAHSETLNYVCNLERRGVYLVHGTADSNVPIDQGKQLRDAFQMCGDDVDVDWHWEQGGDHFWRRSDSDKNSLNWPPLLDFFKNRTLDPHELEFEFTSPGPYYSDEHSYVRVVSADSPIEDVVLESSKVDDKKVELTTTNVRSMEIDGTALADKGIETLVVDGNSKQVESKTLTVGPESGKGQNGVHGTLNEAFREPFCFVYPEGSLDVRDYVSYLVSNWSIRGNGYACAVPLSEVDADLRADRNLIYVGVPFDAIPGHQDRPFSWTTSEISIGGNSYGDAVGFFLFPANGHANLAIAATDGSESLLYRHMPLTSRSGMPDYLILGERRGQTSGLGFGFFDAEWAFDSNFGVFAP